MLTLVLQNVVTLFIWVFALASLGVFRATGVRPSGLERRTAWLLTGTAFGVHALNKTLQGAFGIAAFAAGPGTGVWNDFLFWNPIFNHSRTFLLLAYCGAVAALSLRREPFSPRQVRLAAAAMGVGLLAGGVLGWAEQGFSALRHYSAVAQWDVVEMLVLLATMFVAMLGTRVDRMLWFALGVYAFSLALNVLWFAAFSRIGIPGQWAPRPWEIQAYRVVLFAVMAWLAVHRVRLARRGTAVPALMEPASTRISLVG